MGRVKVEKTTGTAANMHDVARVAGVSQMTVSRVMRDSGYISETVKKKVRAAARDLGYIHNRLAAGKSSYDNPIVGVVVPTLENRVFTEVLSGITEKLTKNGLRPVFGVTEYSEQIEEDVVFDLLEWRPRGLILPGLEHSHALRKIVQQTGVQTVEIMDVDGEPMQDCIGISQIEAGSEMAKHLLERGYRKFALAAGHDGKDRRAAKRQEAFRQVVSEAGAQIVSERTSTAASSMTLGRRITADLLTTPQPPDAIYYSNDDLAAGGVMHCLSNCIAMPSEIAIAGFNGLEFLDALPVKVTTTQTPRYRIGEIAAGLMVDVGHGAPRTSLRQIDTELIRGETT